MIELYCSYEYHRTHTMILLGNSMMPNYSPQLVKIEVWLRHLSHDIYMQSTSCATGAWLAHIVPYTSSRLSDFFLISYCYTRISIRHFNFSVSSSLSAPVLRMSEQAVVTDLCLPLYYLPRHIHAFVLFWRTGFGILESLSTFAD